MERLLYSRKFWLLVLDTVISVILHFIAQGDPAQAENVKFLITAIQPVFVVIIGAIAVEDYAAKASGNWPGVTADKDAHSKS